MRRSRLWRVPLALAGLALAWGAVLLLGEWAWSSHVIARERERISGELKRLRTERVERPILFGPEEEGNAWDLIAEAARPASKEWNYTIWSALFLDSKTGLKPMPEAERDRILDSIQPQFDLLKRALRRRWTEPVHWSEETLVNGGTYLGENRLLGVMAGAIVHRQGQARHEEATDLILTCLGVADRFKVKGSVWSDMSASMGDRFAHAAIRRLLADPSHPAEQLKRLALALEDLAAAPAPDMQDVHRRQSVDHGFIVHCLADDLHGVRTNVLDEAFRPGLRDVWSWRNRAARWLQNDRAERNELERVAHLPPAEWMADVHPLNLDWREPEMRRYWHLVSHAQCQLGFAMSRIALAVSLFAESRNRWPQDLSELTPEFLPAVPLDPWTRKPFRLERRQEDAVIVAPELEDRVAQALSTSQFRATEWRTWTVVRRRR